MTNMTDLDAERCLLDCDKLPHCWHLAYGIKDRRREALRQKATHSDSFFNPTSETAMTVFMLGRLEGWEQAQLANKAEAGIVPRRKSGDWCDTFFRRFATQWDVGDSP